MRAKIALIAIVFLFLAAPLYAQDIECPPEPKDAPALSEMQEWNLAYIDHDNYGRPYHFRVNPDKEAKYVAMCHAIARDFYVVLSNYDILYLWDLVDGKAVYNAEPWGSDGWSFWLSKFRALNE